MKRAVKILAAGFVLFSSAKALADDQAYFYCQTWDNQSYRAFVSSAFSAASDANKVGMRTSFDKHVSAHYSVFTTRSLCLGPYSSSREATDEMNSGISRNRSSGATVVEVPWSY